MCVTNDFPVQCEVPKILFLAHIFIQKMPFWANFQFFLAFLKLKIVKKKTDATSETNTEIQLAEQAKRIRSVIEAYARDNNVIILMKGTVFGADVTEVTDEISMLL
jgi:hypothetical protein